MNIFSKKPTAKELMRETERTLKKTQRDIERERADLEKQEKKLEMEIKQAAKTGNKEVLAILAKQLINVRKQKTKTLAINSRISGISTQGKMMNSNAKMAGAMATTTKTMVSMGKVLDPAKTAASMREFERESMKMGMTEEMMNDALDDALNESGDESEEDAIVNQVLDEIGIEVSGKMINAPAAHRGELNHAKKTEIDDDDLEKQLAKLRAL